jgi:hypothetical protein
VAPLRVQLKNTFGLPAVALIILLGPFVKWPDMMFKLAGKAKKGCYGGEDLKNFLLEN